MAHRAKKKTKTQKRGQMMSKFRFEDLEIWVLAKDLAKDLFDLADRLEGRKLFRFADQLRGSGLSMSNNIAEGSGSSSKKEFYQFLNYAKRSVFENANMLIIFYEKNLVDSNDKEKLLDNLDMLSRKITNFQRKICA